ncbi:MAG: PKD domain-containing protein [Candidatus Thermoplasmatota archaeon]|nr:PKD domain-containing protein [Candidatus Thermoplasmatota archaeon]
MKTYNQTHFQLAGAIGLLSMLILSSSGATAITAAGAALQPHTHVVCSLSDSTVHVTIPIGDYEISRTDVGDEIAISTFGSLLIPGKPQLPSKIFGVAIPPGNTVVSVSVETGEGIQLPGIYEIVPSPLPRVIGEEDLLLYHQDQLHYEQNYQTVYGSTAPYPSQVGEFVRTAYYRRYTIADVQITPVVYHPASKQLVYYPEVTINVQYAPTEECDIPLSDSHPVTKQVAQDILINYEQAQSWYPKDAPMSRDLYNYVIITLDSLTGSVSPLVDWETSKGRSVTVVTTTQIAANYTGYDLSEKIRNFLREKYPTSAWGILDVLLVGGYNDVPIRRTWQDLGYGKPETDYYFAELSLSDSDSWDKDGDHHWGENSDPIDFYTEVTVGRIPSSDPTTVYHICEKSAAYEQNDDPSFKENILLLGAFFWADTDNAVLMEYKTNPTLHPWMSSFTSIKMYEDAQSAYPCDYDLLYNNVLSVWSTGSFAFVNWAGHGSPDAAWEYYYPDDDWFVNTATCTSLNDDYPSIVFADSCSNSDTDHFNIGQAMLQQGAVGFLGATKVALGCPGWNNPNDGSSQSLDYYFTTSVTSGQYTQGAAHQWALRQMYTNGLWNYYRYEMFEWGSLWGNPDLGMAPTGSGTPPETPAQPTGPTTGMVHQNYTFCVTTPDDPDGDVVFLRWYWGDGTGSNWLGPYTEGEQVCIDYAWELPGTYAVKVKAKDINGSQSTWSEPWQITIVEQPALDILLIQGGLGVSAVVKNNGTSDLTNVSWSISLESGFILYGKTKTSVVDLQANEVVTLRSFIFGAGKPYITVTIDDVEQTVRGHVFGPFVFGVG